MSEAGASDLDTGALARWAQANIEGFQGPARLTRLNGGQSNPTYRLDTPSRTYVVRRKPFGSLLPSAHAIEREYRLISALHPLGLPVPRPYGLCEDASIIGAAFYVMDHAEGRIFWQGILPDQAPAERTAIYNDMIDQLARLHNVDYAAAGLGDYGKAGNYFERQVARWTRQYHASQTDDLPVVENLISFLARSTPAQSRTSIIHGDYRIDNLIYAPAQPRVIAIIDWELSTLGDPLADFAYLAMNWAMPAGERAGLMGNDFSASGIPDLDQAIERYCRQTDRGSIPDLNWYFAYNLFRLMAIVQGIKKRIQDGNAASPDAEATATRVLPLAESAWAFAVKAGA